ncbi:MAG: DUF3098 domain-containing protein [Rikenellaceae bacterium]
MSKKNEPQNVGQKVNNQIDDEKMALPTKSYKLLLIGFGVIILGFLLMIGGEAASPEGFNENIFSWRRITLAPIVLVAGFLIEVYAIMKK